MKKEKHEITPTVTIPRWLFNRMSEDSELIKHLSHYRGYGWIKAVKKEMELDKKYNQGAFKKTDTLKPLNKLLALNYGGR